MLLLQDKRGSVSVSGSGTGSGSGSVSGSVSNSNSMSGAMSDAPAGANNAWEDANDEERREAAAAARPKRKQGWQIGVAHTSSFLLFLLLPLLLPAPFLLLVVVRLQRPSIVLLFFGLIFQIFVCQNGLTGT